MSSDNTAGVIGLGIMGGALAGHLAAAGIRTLGYDLLEARRQALHAAGGFSQASVSAVARESSLLITSLPHEQALEEVLFGAGGVVSAARPGLLVIETSTLTLAAKERARAGLLEAGIAMLDAPLSGTGAQALRKDICVLASGDRVDFDRACALLSHCARSVRYVGPFGAGSKVKYIANLLIAVHTLAAAEALVLGEKAGFNPAALLDILLDSAASSRMLEVRGASMAAGTYQTPAMKLDVFQKDLEIIAGFARESSCPVPLLTASLPIFTAAAAHDLGSQDTAAVIAILQQLAGLRS